MRPPRTAGCTEDAWPNLTLMKTKVFSVPWEQPEHAMGTNEAVTPTSMDLALNSYCNSNFSSLLHLFLSSYWLNQLMFTQVTYLEIKRTSY